MNSLVLPDVSLFYGEVANSNFSTTVPLFFLVQKNSPLSDNQIEFPCNIRFIAVLYTIAPFYNFSAIVLKLSFLFSTKTAPCKIIELNFLVISDLSLFYGQGPHYIFSSTVPLFSLV